MFKLLSATTMDNVKNIGVTGAEGFIGRHLISELLKRGEYRISSIDKPSSRFHTGPRWKAFVKSNDVIVHLAGINRDTNDMLLAGNAGETFHMMDAIAQLERSPHVIYISSTQAGNGTPYGTAKKIAEDMLRGYSNHCGIPVTVLRLTNVFGEGCRPFYNSVIATFCYQIADGKDIHINDPAVLFRFVYVGNVVGRIVKEIERRAKGFRLRTISSSNQISIGDLAKTIRAFAEGIKTPETAFEKKLHSTYISYGDHNQ